MTQLIFASAMVLWHTLSQFFNIRFFNITKDDFICTMIKVLDFVLPIKLRGDANQTTLEPKVSKLFHCFQTILFRVSITDYYDVVSLAQLQRIFVLLHCCHSIAGRLKVSPQALESEQQFGRSIILSYHQYTRLAVLGDDFLVN